MPPNAAAHQCRAPAGAADCASQPPLLTPARCPPKLPTSKPVCNPLACRWAVDQLFVVGDQRDIAAAAAIQQMCARHSVQCAVLAIPKSIDNDMLLVGGGE